MSDEPRPIDRLSAAIALAISSSIVPFFVAELCGADMATALRIGAIVGSIVGCVIEAGAYKAGQVSRSLGEHDNLQAALALPSNRTNATGYNAD